VASSAGAAGALAGLQRGLVGYWRFDQPKGALGRDLSPRANHCELRGRHPNRAVVDGPLASAVSLGSVWFECQRPAVASAADNAMTVSAWIRPSQIRKFHGALVSQQRGDAWDKEFMLSVIGNELEVTSGVWNVTLLRPLGALNRWVHVAFTRERGGRVRLFIGGKVMGETVGGPGAAEPAEVGTLTIGATITDAGAEHVRQRFFGAMDELLVYERALAPEEIAALAEGVQPPIDGI
jgi:hypothetical protein